MEAQFTGYNVQHFNSDNGLANTIKGIVADKKGFVWLATESGLVRFDGNRFKIYDRSETGMPVTRLFTVGIAENGKIYTNVQYGGFHYVTSNNTLKYIPQNQLFHKDKLPQVLKNSVAGVLLNKYVVKRKSGQISDRFMPLSRNDSRSYFNTALLNNGHYYYVTPGKEIAVTDTLLTHFNTISFTGAGVNWNIPSAAENTQLSLLNDNGDILLRRGDTIYSLDISRDKRSAFAKPVLPVGNILNIIGMIELPGAAATIIATATDGIYVFKKQNFDIVPSDNRDANVFYAQAPFEKEGVLTAKGVLMPGKFSPFRENYFAYSVLKTNNNTYWLNRRSIDSFSLCLLNNRLEKIKEIPISDGGVNCMQQLKDGSVWISTSDKFIGRVEEDHVEWYERPATLSNEFLVNTFIEAAPNKFWVGGKIGLAKIDILSKEVELIPGLSNAYVRSLYTDATGVLWIGTYGNGFYAWHKDKLVAFPMDANGYLKYVHTFMPDKSGRLWMSTNNGLFVVPLQDLYNYMQFKKQPYYYYYDKTGGFLTNEFNGGCTPAGIVLGNGKFSLPSINGLVQFFPDSIKPVFPDAEIFLDNVVADTFTIHASGKHIILPHIINRVQFYISSPYFGSSYNQYIEYSIDKDNANWYRLNDDHIIELNNLRKGQHSIVLRKQAGFGMNALMTKEIVFTVEAAFYETLFFKCMLLAIFLLLLYFIYRLRIRFLLNQKEWLEKEVSEKTKEQHALIKNLEAVVTELAQSKDALEKSMMFRETLAMIVAHDLQSPLRFLSDAMERMHIINKNADADTMELSMELKNTSANIHQFVEEFSIWIKKVNIAGYLHFTPVHIAMLLSELEVFFLELQKIKGNKIIMQTLPEVYVHTDYQLLKIILRNIIDNANKHTHNGTICIQVCANHNNVTIQIADTGEGMKPALLQRLIQRTNQPASIGYNEEINGIGFGYRFVTDFCRMLDISLNIESRLKQGTTITLSNLKISADSITSDSLKHA